LAKAKPLTTAAVQALLKDREAVVLFLDVPQMGNVPGETLTWIITKAEVRWARIELASEALTEHVAALRCGLDRGAWDGELKQLCRNLLGTDGEKTTESLPFDLTRAHQLYQTLFGQIEDLTKGKHLLIVSSGALTQIPFNVLVTEQPN